MWRVYLRNHRSVGPMFTRLEQQPSWAVKIAVLTAVIVFAVPIVLLTLVALFVGVIIFGLLIAFASIRQALTGRIRRRTDDGGRVNVRIVQR